MKKDNKGLQYHQVKAKNLYMIYIGLALSVFPLILGVILWIRDKEFIEELYIPFIYLLFYIFYLLYAKFSSIKRRILYRYGVKHDAEIIKARYGSPGRWGIPSYYLEIEFTNSKGKKKTLYTPAYDGNPNYYLKDTVCSVYEWKGFYVESDFQMRDEIDYFGYAGIPTEKKHFIWR